MLQIYAGNVPTVAAWPLVSALLLKSALLGKTAAQEPIFAPLLARAIAEVDPDLGAAMAIVWWKGGQAELDHVALERAPAVLAFGGSRGGSPTRPPPRPFKCRGRRPRSRPRPGGSRACSNRIGERSGR
jgi:acyl-CoA reductase-like NAD-dependent aldehyde dehydrogenase